MQQGKKGYLVSKLVLKFLTYYIQENHFMDHAALKWLNVIKNESNRLEALFGYISY